MSRVYHRRSRLRSQSIAPKFLTRKLLAEHAEPIDAELQLDLDRRPRTRGDCSGGARPCPWVTCRHHLYLDINPETGSIKINFPDVEPEDMIESCSLDTADRGPSQLESVGVRMNLTRERTSQIEMRARAKPEWKAVK